MRCITLYDALMTVARHPDSDPEIAFDRGFSQEVRRARESRRWTQADLAHAADCDQADVSRIERYQVRSSTHVRRICRALGLRLPLPETDDPLLQRAYTACRLLAERPDELRIVLSVAEALLRR